MIMKSTCFTDRTIGGNRFFVIIMFAVNINLVPMISSLCYDNECCIMNGPLLLAELCLNDVMSLLSSHRLVYKVAL